MLLCSTYPKLRATTSHARGESSLFREPCKRNLPPTGHVVSRPYFGGAIYKPRNFLSIPHAFLLPISKTLGHHFTYSSRSPIFSKTPATEICHLPVTLSHAHTLRVQPTNSGISYLSHILLYSPYPKLRATTSQARGEFSFFGEPCKRNLPPTGHAVSRPHYGGAIYKPRNFLSIPHSFLLHQSKTLSHHFTYSSRSPIWKTPATEICYRPGTLSHAHTSRVQPTNSGISYPPHMLPNIPYFMAAIRKLKTSGD